MMSKNKIEIYKTNDNQTDINVQFDKDTVWLNRQQLTELFGRDRTVISRHINNIFKEGELQRDMVCAKFAHTTQHGAIEGKTQITETEYFNLDDIHIDLIDRINPFQKAFEILSKSVTTKVLKVIQDHIESTRITMEFEEAKILWPKIQDFIQTFKREPNLKSNDPLEVRMAECIIYLKEEKRKRAKANG